MNDCSTSVILQVLWKFDCRFYFIFRIFLFSLFMGKQRRYTVYKVSVCEVFLARIQFECGKIGTRIWPLFT